MGLAADLAFIGSRVWVRDGTTTAAIAVRGDRVVTPSEEAEASIGLRTCVLHWIGPLVVPGFQDAHTHPPRRDTT